MRVTDYLEDDKRQCISLICRMSLKEYRELAFESFNNNGNFEGQRGVIKRSSAASKIRKRMQEDFNRGAVFPQVVIGLQDNDLEKYRAWNSEIDVSVFSKYEISIIDGMQRSNIYFNNYEGNEDRIIRVEFWIAKDSTQLLYRMLVLNTGQTPWNTRRQLEVIFGNLAQNIRKNLTYEAPELNDRIEIFGVDDGRKRTQAGKYQKSSIIETYLGFNTRNIKVQVSDELAEEYQRFDMIESIERKDSFKFYISVLALMCKLDLALANYDEKIEGEGQFLEGKDLFSSTPVCMGFVVACAEYIMGKVSVERTDEQKTDKLEKLKRQVNIIVEKLESEAVNNKQFLALDTLNEVCSTLSKSRIGDETRRLFKNIFLSILRYDEFEEIVSMEDFWRE